MHLNATTACLQELQALIKYTQLNKQTDSDWFTVTSNKDGTHWSGKCWYVHELQHDALKSSLLLWAWPLLLSPQGQALLTVMASWTDWLEPGNGPGMACVP